MAEQKETVLVIEDDGQIRSFIAYALEQQGYVCHTANTGQDGMAALLTRKIEVLLLDLGLPDMDGMEVIKRVRDWATLPIIVVSARDQDVDIAAALDAGADDYLTKPFSAMELLARVRVAVRHLQQRSRQPESPEVTVGGLTVHFERHLVSLNGSLLHVTPLEYHLLTIFFRNPGKVLTTRYLLRELYGVGHNNDTQALRALMAGLRRKIEVVPAKPRYILTEIGVGYRLASQ
ncbi:MAG: response regulator [Candidatus Spyradenecus sp.]